MNKTISGILFDKDGTLLDYHKSWAGVNEEAAKFAASNDEALARKLLFAAGMDMETGITEAGSALAAGNTIDICKVWIEAGSPVPYDILCIEVDRIFICAAKNSTPVVGLNKTITELVNQGYVLGVASSDSQAAVEAFLSAQNLQTHFSFVAGYDSGYGHKPSSGMMMAFCDEMVISPEEVAVVGDNIHDLEMARAGAAGLSIGVLTGTSSKEILSPLSDYVFESIVELNTLKNQVKNNSHNL